MHLVALVCAGPGPGGDEPQGRAGVGCCEAMFPVTGAAAVLVVGKPLGALRAGWFAAAWRRRARCTRCGEQGRGGQVRP